MKVSSFQPSTSFVPVSPLMSLQMTEHIEQYVDCKDISVLTIQMLNGAQVACV